ncbi:helix-turn-helix transcriptional regulator [Rhodococcus sp. W8901]|nr:helix-turn-helix transcriptional regulator [Rhodococcus sp. W8901]
MQVSYANHLRFLVGDADTVRRVGIQSPDESTRSKRGVYGISVTSELAGIGPQTLRLYESRGLIAPSRTGGGTRRYSEDDLHRLARISELVSLGVNLTGIGRILELEDEQEKLTAENARLRSAVEAIGSAV